MKRIGIICTCYVLSLECFITYFMCSLITNDSVIFLFMLRLIVCFTIAPALYWIILNRGKDYRDG